MSGPRAGERDLSVHQRALLRIVVDHYPDLSISSVTGTSGQFNDILVVNGGVVFRFPRTPDAATEMATEVAALRWLQGRVPVPVPAPTYTVFEDDTQRPLFMGYKMLPGIPLDRATLDDLWITDRAVFERIGQQAGEFLRALHSSPIDEAALVLPRADDAAFWSRMLSAFKYELFTFMRPDAREAIERRFQAHLSDPNKFAWSAAPRHGDFGGANLLFDAESRCLSGVIDFDSVALGDPAIDLAAIEAFHARLAHTMQPAYPELFAPELRRRSAFYKSTFALQQALWALRVGDEGEFEDGIAAYR